MNKLTVTDLQ